MEKPFQKDLSHLSWDQVYARQARRAELISDWMEALRLKSGDRVLEIGAGPGYVSFALANRVGPAGIVYALDRSADALAYLERLQKERGVGQIQRIAADAATLERTDVQAHSALITMVLHHADDPAGILHNVARFVPLGAPVVIGEFHPEGPCEDGPPREHRLAPEKIKGWCEHAGLSVVGYRRQTPEHYVVIAQRGRRSRPRSASGRQMPARRMIEII
ncbi:MAG: methyltransferase domain-containing protein, partial [Pseudolabrys sp.]